MKYLDKDGLSYFYSKVKGKIPTKVSDLTNDSGFTTNTGTITSVKMNGSTVSSSGEADLGTVITSHQNIKTINSTSLVGTGDVSVQPTLVSGTNIKTINNESLLGSGNITISGGGSATDVKINNTSITSSGVADIAVNGTYNYSTNKLVTKNYVSSMISSALNDYVPQELSIGDGNLEITHYTVSEDDSMGLLIRTSNTNTECSIDLCSYYDDQLETDTSYITITAGGGYIRLDDDGTHIDGVYTPTSSNQVANKAYVDGGISNIASAYSKTSTYNVGDYVIYNNILYECTTQISTAENWNSSHWSRVKTTNLIKAKQDTLVSGTNIKTINNQSLLGSGNITISGGGGSATDVQINSTSITSNGVADLKAEGTYNASTNKLVTKNYVANQLANYLPQDSNNGDYYLYVEPFIQGDTAQGLLMQAFSDTGSGDDIANIEMKAYLDSEDEINKASIYMYTQNGGSITIDENGTTITGVVAPTNNSDAVNKKYVDDIVGNINTLLSAI